jgi:uncharacterized membrane protein/protein-disulfide isomerase
VFSSIQNFMSHSSNQPILNAIPTPGANRRSTQVSQENAAIADSAAVGPPSDRRQVTLHPYEATMVAPPPKYRDWRAMLAQLPTPGQHMSLFVAVFGLFAFGVATYMTIPWFFSESKVVGCNGSAFNCDHVMNSRYSNWMGLPVSGLAAGTYLCMLTALVLAQRGSPAKRNFMWAIITFCALSAGAAAMWFIFLQGYVLKHWCQYCLMAHACGIILAVTFLIVRPMGSQINTTMGILALVGLVFLSVGQSLGKEAPTYLIEEHEVIPTPQTLEPGLEQPENSEPNEDVIEAPEDDIFEAPDLSQSIRHLHRVSERAFLVTSFFLPVSLQATALLAIQDSQPVPDTPENQNPETPEQARPQPDQDVDQGNQAQQGNAEAARETRRILEISGGKIKLDVKQWPIAGRTDAEYVCVEMFDYNCQHCRQTHAAVKAAKQKLGDRFAVITLPLPLNKNCNSQVSQTSPQFMQSCLQAELAVAVWKVNPEKFAEFHEWMFNGPTAPDAQKARAHAETLVGKEELDKVLNSTLPAAYIQKHVQIYSRLNGGNIPKLLFRTTSIVGLFQAPDQLVEILQRQGPLTETPVPSSK